MSADIWIVTDFCKSCKRGTISDHEVNITYNLSPMLKAGGFVGWQGLVQGGVGMLANDAGLHLLGVLEQMAQDPDRFRAMNPPNGWGDYDKCLQGRLREFAGKCIEAGPTDRIGGSL